MTYVLHRLILNLMIMVLMMTHAVIKMMMNQLCLIKNYTNPCKWMIVIIVVDDQNLILKTHTMNHDRQNFHHSRNFLEFLIFPILTLFTTIVRHSLSNQTFLCTSTNHNPPIEKLEPNINYDHYRYCLFIPSPSSSE